LRADTEGGPMPYNMSDPQYWLDRAEEVRTRADVMKNSNSKAKMLRIAEDCEDLGRRARQLLKKPEDDRPVKND